MNPYESVVGLEVHVQLKTRSKMFCACPNEFGAEPNANTCPVCLGFPGSLPVLNREAFLKAIQVALALNCEIAERLKFDRKNYFYPDLPKAYQISQYDQPLSFRGYVEVTLEGATKRIRIMRAHLEEDAAKLLHEGIREGSLVDYNRAGIPLLEIVSEPDLRSPDEAYEYLTLLKSILQYVGASDCDMEKGSLRCDANVSIRPRGEKRLGTKVEIKNMNSFSAVRRALAYEIERQSEVLARGGSLIQETRLWNETEGRTLPMRSKEMAHDYRYFPEPDLVPFTVSRELVEEIRRSLPELPRKRRERFMKELGLNEYDARVLTQTRDLADYFEACVGAGAEAKMASNWIQTELLGLLHERGESLKGILVSPQSLSELLVMVRNGTISGKIAKEIFPDMWASGNSAQAIVQKRGLTQVTDEDYLRQQARKVVAENPKSVEDYRRGKVQALGFLVGQLMRETRGKANPQLANEILKEIVESSR